MFQSKYRPKSPLKAGGGDDSGDVLESGEESSVDESASDWLKLSIDLLSLTLPSELMNRVFGGTAMVMIGVEEELLGGEAPEDLELDMDR